MTDVEKVIMTALRRFGESVKVFSRDTEKDALALIQPLRRKHRLFLNEDRLPMGKFDSSYRLYIGEPSCALSDGDTVTYAGTKYTVIMSEMFRFSGKDLYLWAVMKETMLLGEDEYGVDE